MRLLVFAVVSFSVLGCRHHFPLPYTAAQLQEDSSNWPGDALVHYLTQANADVAVCGSSALMRVDDELIDPFVTSLDEQALAPDRWQACATRLVPTLPAPMREYTLGRLARLILSLLENENGAARLLAAHEVLATRPREASPSLDTLMNRLLEWPREKLPPALPPIFAALLITLELDHGQVDGHALTQADITNTQDEALLTRMGDRLPDESLRTAARHRLVQLRIARSETPEVKARAAEVEEAVVRTGRWAQPLSSLKLVKPELPVSLPFTGWLRQDVEAQMVTMLAPGDDDLQVAPTLDLKPTLRFSVGWSRPLALCESPSLMVVEPCIDAADVEVSNELVRLEPDGVLRLPERLPIKSAFELARANEGLVLPVRLHGQLVTSLQVPLRFLEPHSYFFEGSRGEPGPAVNIAVVPTESALLFEAVSQASTRRLVIYPREGRGTFSIGSEGGRGLDGYRGQDGYDGARGYDGVSASCATMQPGQPGGRGGDGGHGGNGGPGGPGGEGGQVSVEVLCGGRCPAEVALVQALVRSKGGRGGDGGSGGRGGSGGSGGNGGSSTSCTSNGQSAVLAGGSSGSSGSRGTDGSSGTSGTDGPDGVVQVNAR